MDTRLDRWDVRHCARCDQDHSSLEFRHFNGQPIDDIWDWWAICPITGDPVLGRRGGYADGKGGTVANQTAGAADEDN
jgi:hypothetical protein